MRESPLLLCEPSSEQWGFAKGTGWGLRVKQVSRIVAYLAPRDGHVLVSFVLGGRAVKAAEDGDVPDAALALIRGGRRYVEGTAVRVEAGDAADVATVLALAGLKTAY